MMQITYQGCPLCGCEKHEFHANGDLTKHETYDSRLPPAIEWRSCTGCGHIFTAGYWTDEALNIILGKTIDAQTVGFGLEANRAISARIVEKVTGHRCVPGGSSWLDVGFGNGLLLFTAQEFGYRCLGLDLRADSVRDLTKLGIEAKQDTILGLSRDSFWLNDRFSVISMADIIEHEPYPGQALAAARQMIADNGVLFISCPNADTLLWRAMGAANPYYYEIEHYHCFTRSRLIALLEQHGFETVHYGINERYLAGMELLCRPKIRPIDQERPK